MARDSQSDENQPAEVPAKKPRGLWQLMGQPQPEAETEVEVEPAPAAEPTVAESPLEETPAPEPPPTAAPRRGLWKLMGNPAVETTAPPAVVPPPPAPASQPEQLVSPAALAEVIAPTAEPDIPVPLSPKQQAAAARLARTSWACLILGGVAVLLSALSLLPAAWGKIPAGTTGFIAVCLGLSVIGEVRRLSRRNKSWNRTLPVPVAGTVLGVVGMVLGPLLFSELGERNRQSYGRRETKANLDLVGEGLIKFLTEHQHYPVGGQFEGDTAMYGWMTALLPYIGEGELYQQINLQVPYDDPENAVEMSTEVPLYLASGSSRARVAERYAVSHYAGLGGEEMDDNGGLAEVGVFGRNLRVSDRDVTDGLSRTLVAGEIAENFPPWGSPENWRSIGKGLNREAHSFGNADRTGAMFLHADGSVRFYSNDTAPEILRQLSTRNGGEVITEE